MTGAKPGRGGARPAPPRTPRTRPPRGGAAPAAGPPRCHLPSTRGRGGPGGPRRGPAGRPRTLEGVPRAGTHQGVPERPSWAATAPPTQPRSPTTTAGGPRGQTNHTAKGFELTQPFLENLGENGNFKKKKTFLKEKRGEKKLLLLMSFIISIEIFPFPGERLLVARVCVWLEAGSEEETQRPTQTATRHTHTPHTFSDTHRSACWLYQTLLLLPAEINLKKNKQF